MPHATSICSRLGTSAIVQQQCVSTHNLLKFTGISYGFRPTICRGFFLSRDSSRYQPQKLDHTYEPQKHWSRFLERAKISKTVSSPTGTESSEFCGSSDSKSPAIILRWLDAEATHAVVLTHTRKNNQYWRVKPACKHQCSHVSHVYIFSHPHISWLEPQNYRDNRQDIADQIFPMIVGVIVQRVFTTIG